MDIRFGIDQKDPCATCVGPVLGVLGPEVQLIDHRGKDPEIPPGTYLLLVC